MPNPYHLPSIPSRAPFLTLKHQPSAQGFKPFTQWLSPSIQRFSPSTQKPRLKTE